MNGVEVGGYKEYVSGYHLGPKSSVKKHRQAVVAKWVAKYSLMFMARDVA